MSDDTAETAIRRAIGGDLDAIAWIAAQCDVTDDPVLVTMCALLANQPDRLDRALSVAFTSRDRQVVQIARAYLGGQAELVDALARDHLVDHPGSLIVAWIASDASGGRHRRDQI